MARPFQIKDIMVNLNSMRLGLIMIVAHQNNFLLCKKKLYFESNGGKQNNDVVLS